MFNHIIHPITNSKLSLFSIDGKSLLKHYVRLIQTGGSRPESIESCEKCHKFYNRMYGTSPSSETTLKAYNFCINCAENLLQERKKMDIKNPNYKQITQDAKAAIANGEKARKYAASGGINLTKIRQTGMEIRKNLGSSTVKSSVPRSVPRSTVRFTKRMPVKCKQAMKIANDMLNKLYDTEYFSISFDDIYTLIMSTHTRDKTFYINPHYEQEYNTLLRELYAYMRNLKMQCSSPNRSKLVNILRFFIEKSDTGGGSEFPVVPQTQLPKISATPQPQKQRVAVAIPSGL
jgi:hypothetical protein